MILGVGTDLVSLPQMAEQLATPGSQFLDRMLTRREHRGVHLRAAGVGPPCTCARDASAVERIGTLWAIKESVVKAWSSALFGTAPPVREEEVSWPEIEVVHDHWHRPKVELHGRIAEAFGQSMVGRAARTAWHVSASREGDFAMATVVLAVA